MSWTDGKSVEQDVAEEARQARGAEIAVALFIVGSILWAIFGG